MKVACIQIDKVISGLQPYLEDARSKNSIIEMPLRRLASCGKLKDVDQQMAEIKGLFSQFSCFKKDWINQAPPYYGTPLSTMLAHGGEVKIHAELKKLEMFIESELRSVKSVIEYNQYVLDQAEDGVDRLLIAEDCRSKNSIIEMPLRRLARSCGKLVKDVDQQMVEINGLSSQFSRSKKDWNHQTAPYNEVPLSKMLAHVEEAKIHAELKKLKMFIESELKSVKSVMEYNQYLLD
ncbi:unnamed protein product [Mytilus coruscus]|uniref:Uncharacterized protein n=1 Tax=Mytilus coruscus TaxID=42192 RepID=A0A6J8B811_MYTCO|nr:unnamed protein product [Mytilus coruscus]